MDQELEDIVAAEVAYLQALDANSELTQDDLRRASVVLNSLLIVEGNGWLFRLARQSDRNISVIAPDNRATVQALDNRVKLYLCGGVGLCGVKLAEVINYGRELSAEEIRKKVALGPPIIRTQQISLGQFLNQTCIVVNGIAVSRQNCVAYVANKRGGKHLDERRTGRHQDQFEALDEIRDLKFTNEQIEPAHFELLATAHYLVQSPDVTGLIT